MPYPSMPSGRATLETALHMIQGSPTCRGCPPAGVAHLQGLPTYRVGGLWPSFTPLDTPTICLWEQNTVFRVVAMSENFVNQNCAIRKVVTSSTHGRAIGGKAYARGKSHFLGCWRRPSCRIIVSAWRRRGRSWGDPIWLRSPGTRRGEDASLESLGNEMLRLPGCFPRGDVDRKQADGHLVLQHQSRFCFH
jgi:hypothetical protein